MRVLVTGAAGFVGSHVVDHVMAAGHAVTAVDDLSRGSLSNLSHARQAAEHRPDAFRFVELDITDPRLSDLAIAERPEVICHLAAQIDVRVSVDDPLHDAQLNVLGTINVLEAARRAGSRKIVFTSSGGAIYGDAADLPVSEDAPVAPLSPYAAGKLAGELYCRAYSSLHGIAHTILAPANIYGPRQDPAGEAGVVAIFGTRLLGGRSGTIFGDGAATRDYVYVEDVADAFVRALSAGDGVRVNIGTGRQTSTRQLHTAIAAVTGGRDNPQFAPGRAGELQASALDNHRAAELLGWRPKTSLEEGLRRTMAWLAERVD